VASPYSAAWPSYAKAFKPKSHATTSTHSPTRILASCPTCRKSFYTVSNSIDHFNHFNHGVAETHRRTLKR